MSLEKKLADSFTITVKITSDMEFYSTKITFRVSVLLRKKNERKCYLKAKFF